MLFLTAVNVPLPFASWLQHGEDGNRFVYLPCVDRHLVLASAIWRFQTSFPSRPRMSSSCFSPSCALLFVTLYLFILLRAVALPAHGDVERNPGPSAAVGGSISNLNSNSSASADQHAAAVACTRPARARGSPNSPSTLLTNARSLLQEMSELREKWSIR